MQSRAAMTSLRSSSLRLLVAGSVPLLAAALAPREAAACSPPPCVPGHAAPAEGATVPGNVPAVPVLLSESFSPSPGSREAPATLLDGQGRPVPTTWVPPGAGSREALLKPDAPLAPGSYRIVRAPVCKLTGAGLPAPAGGEVAQSFTATSPSPLPTTAGAVKVGAAVQKRYNVSASGSCAEEVPAAVVALTLEPSAALVPFLPVARITVNVNGERWAATLPGGAHGPIPRSMYFASRAATELFRVCETKPNVSDRGIPLERVTGEVVVDLPGQGALPPIPFSATLPCGGGVDGGAGGAGVDGGTGGGGGSTGTGGAGGAATSGDAGAPPIDEPRGGGGCSVAPAGAGPGALALAAGLLAALAGRGRRRRR